MLKRLAIFMALASASSTAWADARSECADWKNTPPDRSIATCSEVIRRDARAAWAYINRGLAYHKKADYDRAIADYKRSIEIDPKHALAYNNLATSTKLRAGTLRPSRCTSVRWSQSAK